MYVWSLFEILLGESVNLFMAIANITISIYLLRVPTEPKKKSNPNILDDDSF